LAYFARFSPDNGSTWVTLSPSITETSLEVDISTLPGTSAGIFEVVAGSGLNSKSARTPPFTITAKGPQLAIIGLTNLDVFKPGELVILSGLGYDFEDGALAGSRSYLEIGQRWRSWEMAVPCLLITFRRGSI